jgi:hypothetical protein
MREVSGLVTQTALAIRDEDELEVAASILDAALRRAKADGIRMVETYARACVHERAVQLDGFTGSSGMAGVIRGKQSEADRIVDWADAHAAQIEEG